MERELREFLLRLNAEIRDRALGGTENARPDFKEIVFTEYAGEHLVDVGAIEDFDVCFHEGKLGAGIVKVDGYSIGENSERLDLLTAHFTDDDDPPSLTTEQVTRLAQRAARLIEAARRKQHVEMEPASDAHDMMERIHAALPRIVRGRVHVVTNSVAIARAVPDETISGLPISYEVWDLERLFRSMAAGQPREDIEIDFEAAFGWAIPCVAMPGNDSDYTSYLAIVPAIVLARLYQDYGPRLLEYNVRAFLQATGKVNRGIRDTLRSEPARFMAYNNGISVTVDSLETTQCDGQLAIRRVRGLQIVNGAQTTASLHRAGRRDGVNLSLVSVPAKITVVSRDLVDRMVPLISLYANTQNVIQIADFSANEPFHVEFERRANTIWCPGERGRWFYERARGQYQVARAKSATPAQQRRFNEQTPPHRKITKTDLARYLNAWDQAPQVVSAGAQKNFVRFMRDLRQARGKDWQPDEHYFRDAIAKALIFKSAERIIRRAGLPGYRSQVATYLVSYLSRRSAGRFDLAEVWRQQGLSAPLETMLQDWMHSVSNEIVRSAGGLNVTEWCKKDGCWDAISHLNLSLPDPLPVEFLGATMTGVDGRQSESMSPGAYDDLAECKKLSGDDWFAIHAWGQRAGLLAGWQIGIAHTLSGYASGGWRKEPSLKQAKQGARIIAIARDHGQLPRLPNPDVEARP